jgi:hypothetical protein
MCATPPRRRDLVTCKCNWGVTTERREALIVAFNSGTVQRTGQLTEAPRLVNLS